MATTDTASLASGAGAEARGKLNTPDEVRMRKWWQWRVLFALCFCYLFYYTGRQNFGWALSSMNQSLGYSMHQLGWISFAMLMTYGIGQFINGSLGDKYGGRVMVTVGGILSCVFNWITSFGTSFWTILAPWAANGYAQSMAWAPGSRMLSNWWPHEDRGKVYGLYVFSAASSSILIFAIGAGIAAMHLSWEWMFRLPVLLLAVACIVFYFLARNSPEELGFSSVEDDPNHARPEVEESAWERYRHVMKDWRFVLATLSIGFASLARYGLIIWVPVHLMGPAYADHTVSVWIGVALPVGMAFGTLSAGYLSDRFCSSNRSGPIALFMGLTMVVLFLIYILPPQWIGLGVVMLFLSGFLVFGPYSLYWALCPDLMGRYRAATATGVMNMWAYFVAAATDPLIGWIIDLYGTTVLFLILSVSCALSALVILPIRR